MVYKNYYNCLYLNHQKTFLVIPPYHMYVPVLNMGSKRGWMNGFCCNEYCNPFGDTGKKIKGLSNILCQWQW